MDAEEMKHHIRETFAGIRMAEADGDTFVTYDPDGDLPADRWLPFATIVTGDSYDTVSDLSHPDTYRLNLGVPSQTYTTHLGPPPTARNADGVLLTEADYTARDQLMPHPIYANQHWLSVINPGEKTLETTKTLVADAYNFAVRKHKNRESRAQT